MKGSEGRSPQESYRQFKGKILRDRVLVSGRDSFIPKAATAWNGTSLGSDGGLPSGSLRTRLKPFLHGLMILALCVTTLNARSVVSVTVRGVLSRGGKAGNLWTLTLDSPLQTHDPGPANPQATVRLEELRFIGGRTGPQDPSYDGKHVEVTGTLISPFGPRAAGVRVRTITLIK